MVNVTITTAVDLSNAQLDQIKKAVTKKYGKDVQFTSMVDSSIIGGVQITIGSKQLDGSLKNKIAQLKKSIVQSD